MMEVSFVFRRRRQDASRRRRREKSRDRPPPPARASRAPIPAILISRESRDRNDALGTVRFSKETLEEQGGVSKRKASMGFE